MGCRQDRQLCGLNGGHRSHTGIVPYAGGHFGGCLVINVIVFKELTWSAYVDLEAGAPGACHCVPSSKKDGAYTDQGKRERNNYKRRRILFKSPVRPLIPSR